MAKIPTFTSTEEMTTQTGAVTSDLQISPARNIFTATESLQSTLTKEYVREKKLEADNKATLILKMVYLILIYLLLLIVFFFVFYFYL